MEDNRVVIYPQDVLNFLADGKTREEIRTHYNLSKGDMIALFKHPDLKGRKTKKAPGFVFATPSEAISDRDNETNAVQNESDNVQDSATTNGTQSEEELEGQASYVQEQEESGERPSQWAN